MDGKRMALSGWVQDCSEVYLYCSGAKPASRLAKLVRKCKASIRPSQPAAGVFPGTGQTHSPTLAEILPLCMERNSPLAADSLGLAGGGLDPVPGIRRRGRPACPAPGNLRSRLGEDPTLRRR